MANNNCNSTGKQGKNSKQRKRIEQYAFFCTIIRTVVEWNKGIADTGHPKKAKTRAYQHQQLISTYNACSIASTVSKIGYFSQQYRNQKHTTKP